MKLLCSSFVIVLGAYLLISASGYAYFTDTETVPMSVATGTWGEQSDDVTFDISGALLTGHGSQGFHLHDIVLNNTGDQPLVITGIIVGWDPDDGEMLEQVQICDATSLEADSFWSGTTGSGSYVEGVYVLGGTCSGNVHFWFDSDMSGKTITLTFIFDDGSQKGVSVLV